LGDLEVVSRTIDAVPTADVIQPGVEVIDEHGRFLAVSRNLAQLRWVGSGRGWFDAVTSRYPLPPVRITRSWADQGT
jgi:hypothetical protein